MGGEVDLIYWSTPCGHCGSNDRSLVSKSGATLVDHCWDFRVSPDRKWLISLTLIDASASVYRLTALDLDHARVAARQELEMRGLREDSGPTFTTLWWPGGPRAVCLLQKAVRASPDSIIQDSSLHCVEFDRVPSLLRTVFHERETPHLTSQSWAPDGTSIAFFLRSSDTSAPWKLMNLKLDETQVLREVSRTSGDVERIQIVWEDSQPRLRR